VNANWQRAVGSLSEGIRIADVGPESSVAPTSAFSPRSNWNAVKVSKPAGFEKTRISTDGDDTGR
jgi:hypothetical protein